MTEDIQNRTCSECRGSVESDEHFCGSCGASIEAQRTSARDTRVCPECDAVVDGRDAFCIESGRELAARGDRLLEPTDTVPRSRQSALVPEAPARTAHPDGLALGGPGQSLIVAALAAVVFSVGLRLTTLLLGLIDTSPELGSVDWLGLFLSLVSWLVPFFFVATVLAATKTARMSVLWMLPLISLACFAIAVGGLIIYLINLTLGSLSWLVWVFNISGMLAAFVPFGIAVAIAGHTALPRWGAVVYSAILATVTGVAAKWMASGWIQIDLNGLTFLEGDWIAALREYLFLTLMTFTLFGLFQLRWRVVATPAATGVTPRPQPVGVTGLVIAAATVVVLGVGAGLIAISQSDAYAEAAGEQCANYAWHDDDAYYEGYEEEGVDDGYDESSDWSADSTFPSGSDTTTPSTGPTVRPIRPVSAVATDERKSVNLRCTGERVSYDAIQLIDGDMNTGWGAGEINGTRQSVTVRFAERVRLSRVGLTPGFAKFGPRQDRGCASVEAFPLNRWVTSVRYTFDDGTSVLQDFQRRKDLQYVQVDVVTQSVEITILSTDRPPGADDDTVLSEAAFEGSPA